MTTVETDELFGAVTIRVDTTNGWVHVSGAELPDALLRRRNPGRIDPHSPIGTRDGGSLALQVAGIDGLVRPAPGGLTRRSYRVEVSIARVGYQLTPDGRGTSSLRRDDTQLGRLIAAHEHGVRADWNPLARVQPSDAAVGYLFAAAFGTGAPALWEIALGVLNNIPIG